MPQTAAHWLDIMPEALDLVDGLPVRVGPGYERWDHSGTVLGADCSPLEMRDGYGETQIVERGDVRIDLDDPQGFGYALRMVPTHDEGWIWRWLRGQTTDADRLALAYALAEVQA